MPIWADFMREALNLYPEWNGDWQMPETVRQAEIDSRSGKLIRELNTAEADPVKAQQTAVKGAKEKTDPNSADIEPPKEIYITDVPSEFRRIEYFVGGTVPNKAFLPTDETGDDPNAKPEATATPFTTWQEQQMSKGNPNSQNQSPEPEKNDAQKNLTIMICPTTGFRATLYCPVRKPETFIPGSEPNEFCPFHTKPPN